jgi:hypothetical protein
MHSSEAGERRGESGGVDEEPFTFTGACTFTFSTAPYEPVVPSEGPAPRSPLEGKRTACWRSWKSKTGLGLGFGRGRGWSPRCCADWGVRIESMRGAPLGQCLKISSPSKECGFPEPEPEPEPEPGFPRGLQSLFFFSNLRRGSLEAGGGRAREGPPRLRMVQRFSELSPPPRFRREAGHQRSLPGPSHSRPPTRSGRRSERIEDAI